MSTFVAVDLSLLPAPMVVEPLDYEQILAERKARLLDLWPPEERAEIEARLALESEPLTKLLQENAYRELVWRQRVNEAAMANLLPFARGADLDNLVANFNVRRLVIRPADPAATPPVPALLESDDSLRERAQMAWEGLSTAGPRNSYIFHARSASGLVADASAYSPSPAEVVVTVQSFEGDGTPSAQLLTDVATQLNDEDRRPVADRVTVQAAEIVRYAVSATLYMLTAGPESELALAAARTRLERFVTQRRRLGLEISRSILHACLHVEGVRKVTLEGWQDIAATLTQAPYCTGITLRQGHEG
ncbi:baseplate assembly protein [Pseudomonas entomophila]|uniref:baseplate J/gp47 family protein n=1 Tax=Pseudomonas entomophila TaxID=312306 RepID=UPI0015E39DBB|nr:baseplate J/gp47 family protein [Pseudomonas entomophila]MBA1187561.1 baseplate assembly protein [Pseudomonas entomophila]